MHPSPAGFPSQPQQRAASLARAALGIRKRNALRLGFGVLISVLVFSTVHAYRIQIGLSEETTSTYHRHYRQADLLFQLRRTLWLGANASRDFLLNPHADRVQSFLKTLTELQHDSARLFQQLGQAELPQATAARLQSRVFEFWRILSGMPDSTSRLGPAQRFQFVQREIVPRRNAVGDLVRDFTAASANALKQAEAGLAETRREAASRLLLSLGLSLTIAVLVVGFSLRHSAGLERETARQYDEVAGARAELQQLSARLMDIQETERTRLSRELHDEIGQALATLRLELSRAESIAGLSPDELRQRLASSRALAERTIQTVRNISVLLRPAILDDLGVGPALQWLVEDFTRRTGILCELEEQWSNGDALPQAVRTCVYRVLQEALHNCEKHAQATRVRVQGKETRGSLEVIVEDNGRGFDIGAIANDQPHTRFGLLGMRERAAALGGEVRFESAPGRGTRLTLTVPVPSTADASKSAAGAQIGAG